MPPLAPKQELQPRVLSEAEQQEERERRAKEQTVYGQMWHTYLSHRRHTLGTLVLNRDPTTPVVEYPIPGEPPFRKMTAWLAGNRGGVELVTQVIEEVDGKTIRNEAPESRAATSPDGELVYDDLPSHDANMSHLNDIEETLDLIVKAAVKATQSKAKKNS